MGRAPVQQAARPTDGPARPVGPKRPGQFSGAGAIVFAFFLRSVAPFHVQFFLLACCCSKDFSQVSVIFWLEGFELGSCLFAIEVESTVLGFLVLCQFSIVMVFCCVSSEHPATGWLDGTTFAMTGAFGVILRQRSF